MVKGGGFTPRRIVGTKVKRMQVLLKSFQKCKGDLMQDGDEFRCWQCGNYYYPKIELPE
jgi:hypothetical protein